MIFADGRKFGHGRHGPIEMPQVVGIAITKPKRAAEQRADEEAIRRQHAATPVRQRPAGDINSESFAEILRLVARFKAARESQGLTLADVAERMGIDSRAVPTGNRQDAEPNAHDTAQTGGSTRAEIDRTCDLLYGNFSLTIP